MVPRSVRRHDGVARIGDLCLSLSKIVTAARTVAEDPAVDGFGHHNPQLGQEDDLFYNALAIDRFMEGFFQGRDLSTNETQFFRLMRMGILDGREGYDMPMTSSCSPVFIIIMIVTTTTFLNDPA